MFFKSKQKDPDYASDIAHLQAMTELSFLNSDDLRQEFKKLIIANQLLQLADNDKQVFLDVTGITMQELTDIKIDVYTTQKYIKLFECLHLGDNIPLYGGVVMTKEASSNNLFEYVTFTQQI